MSHKKHSVGPANFPWHMPQEVRDIIMGWEVATKSPHSHSYYDRPAGEIGWGSKPLDSLRVSDHWNFHTGANNQSTKVGVVHCPTDRPIAQSEWAISRWDGERYIVLETYKRSLLTSVNDQDAKRLSPSLQRQREKNLERLKHWKIYEENRHGS